MGAHVGQAVYFRTWWLLLTVVVCGILEVAGWSARLWSSWSPRLSTPYEMQLTCTIIGPTPLVAANFVILGTIIKSLGTEFSRIAPKWSAQITNGFNGLNTAQDVIALFVQGIGGGVASAAVAKGKNPETVIFFLKTFAKH
ncbi:envelope glycoprotein [Paramarasmius palmivorus]|uniref:Envelope glycoprotein n=1 Tax=Paramarasmius palmivorus TaxID=297713 RepID=A0AAW0D0F7_9AGAR